jgi:hypothetical protein
MFGPDTNPPAEHCTCAIERTSKAMHLRPVCRKRFGITGVDKTIPIFEFVAATLASFRFPAELPPGSR